MNLKLSSLISAAVPTLSLVLCTQLLHADPIFIGDAGFEEFYTDSSKTTAVTLTGYTYGMGTTASDGFSTAGYVPYWVDNPHDSYSGGVQSFGTGAPEGSNVGYMGNNGGTLSQTLGATALDNSTYTLTFVAQSSSTGGLLTAALFDGAAALTLVSATEPALTNTAWSNYSYTFTTADVDNGTNLSLVFTHASNPEIFLDDVKLSVVPTEVPEPSTFASVALGFGALTMMLRRRVRA